MNTSPCLLVFCCLTLSVSLDACSGELCRLQDAQFGENETDQHALLQRTSLLQRTKFPLSATLRQQVKAILPRLKDAEKNLDALQKELDSLKTSASLKSKVPSFGKTAATILAGTAFYVGPCASAVRACTTGECDSATLAGTTMSLIGSAVQTAAVLEPIGAVLLISGELLTSLFGKKPAGPPPLTLNDVKAAVRSELQNFEEKKVMEFDMPVWNQQAWETLSAVSEWSPANKSTPLPVDQAQQFLTFLSNSAVIFSQDHEILRSWRVVLDSPDSARARVLSKKPFSTSCNDDCSVQSWSDDCDVLPSGSRDDVGLMSSYLNQFSYLSFATSAIHVMLENIRNQPGWNAVVGSSLDAYGDVFLNPVGSLGRLANHSLLDLPSCLNEQTCDDTTPWEDDNLCRDGFSEDTWKQKLGDRHCDYSYGALCRGDDCGDFGKLAKVIISCKNNAYRYCVRPNVCAAAKCVNLLNDENNWTPDLSAKNMYRTMRPALMLEREHLRLDRESCVNTWNNSNYPR
eukprot:TRINITY_DN23486_c0_g1_i1.p1 TRINITY_DN23486_c0_g1~~TRINITY_DN23486_c0_g1_i1.p1  ORF type:complete len:516 (-),score=57.51 TRINITY_DN23486_c0_g1_i1:454-2001(-)